MQYFTADMFVDALILLLHNRTDHTLQMVSALLEIYEAETKNSTYIENETFAFYVFLLHEIISRKITINDTAEIEAFLLLPSVLQTVYFCIKMPSSSKRCLVRWLMPIVQILPDRKILCTI